MILLAGDLMPSDVGATVAVTSSDSIRGRLDAVEPRLGGALIDLTVDGRPFTVFSDLPIHIDRPVSRDDVDALLRANDANLHSLLMGAITRGRTQDA